MGMHWSHWQCQLHQIPDIPQTCAKSTSYEFGEIIWVPRQTFRIRSLLISTGVRKKNKSNINHPVGGFSPTHLKNMRKSKWEASSPNIRGENSPRKIFELPPPPIVIFGRRPATSSLRKGTSKSRCVILKVTFVPAAFVASICMALVLPTRRSTAVMMGMENTATWTADSTVRPYRWVIPNKNPPKPSIKHEKWWEQPTDSKK